MKRKIISFALILVLMLSFSIVISFASTVDEEDTVIEEVENLSSEPEVSPLYLCSNHVWGPATPVYSDGSNSWSDNVTLKSAHYYYCTNASCEGEYAESHSGAYTTNCSNSALCAKCRGIIWHYEDHNTVAYVKSLVARDLAQYYVYSNAQHYLRCEKSLLGGYTCKSKILRENHSWISNSMPPTCIICDYEYES